jgi:DNA-binding response OmpR family regulator
MHALIVEDDPALQNFYDRILQQFNFDVHIAIDGEQAIAFLSGNAPELIVLDMRLPYLNGVHILDFIAQTPHLNAVHVVIATASQEFEQYVQKVPSSEFLLKPVLPNQISEIAARIRNGA